jgi:hypothetical protein
MATSKQKDSGPNIRYDAFIKQVRPDPGQTDPVAVLNGYVGESGSDDKIRLYADESLSEYVDIAKSDILYAEPDEENPLGGSRVWVKQQAQLNHSDAYSQGDMYNEYMGNTYDGGYGNMGPGVTLDCTIVTSPAICKPTRFICPTPVSKLVICNITNKINCNIITANVGCNKPSWVDACPSAWVCPTNTINQTINQTIKVPGGFDAGYGDYTGGDMYSDYMQDSYDGGSGGEAFGGGPLSIAICPGPLPRTIRIWDCWRPTRQRWCDIQVCQTGTIRITIPTPRTPGCATDITRTIETIRTVNIPGGFDAGYGDYAGGDMYNDYMQGGYDGGTGSEAFGPNLPTVPINQCARVTVPINQCFQVSQPVWTCINVITVNRIYCPIPTTCFNNTRPITCIVGTRRPCVFGSRVPGSIVCATDFTRTINQTINIPGGFDGGYGDYTGGDMYNDYMQGGYDGGAEAFAPGATQLCTGPVSRPPICPIWTIPPRCPILSAPPRCPLSLPPRCPILSAPPRCPVTCQFGTRPITNRCPSLVDGCPSQWGCTIDTTVINPGRPFDGGYGDYAGGDMYNDYMQGGYDGGEEAFGAGAATAFCTTGPVSLVCPTFTRPPRCPILTIPPRCPILTIPPRCPVTCAFNTRPISNRCPSLVDGCPSQWGCNTLQTGTTVINPGTPGRQFDGGYNDYTGGDMYNNYLTQDYSGESNMGAGAGVAYTTPVCTVGINCPRQTSPVAAICLRTFEQPCQIQQTPNWPCPQPVSRPWGPCITRTGQTICQITLPPTRFGGPCATFPSLCCNPTRTRPICP